MRNDYTALSDIQSDVLGYLEAHPNAMDTVDGIRQWWLTQQRMAMYTQDRVQNALYELRDANLLEMNVLDSGKEVFKLAKHEVNKRVE